MDIEENAIQKLKEAEFVNVGGSPIDSQVTLCVYSDNLDPDEVSDSIGCLPTRARRKGESYLDRPKIRPAPIGQWFLEAPNELPFMDKIEHVLNSTTCEEAKWATLAINHRLELRTAIFLRSWTEGFAIAPEQLQELARRKWSFSLSMYSADGEEIIDAFLHRTSGNDQ